MTKTKKANEPAMRKLLLRGPEVRIYLLNDGVLSVLHRGKEVADDPEALLDAGKAIGGDWEPVQ